ncbi:MAG: ribose-phosphate diphosphokinase, partial [Candidatus Micrarchaeota archaeon]|nr:ribose-phosphate diphosphokinase [Candidatus Micrarchaeota archaeon]
TALVPYLPYARQDKRFLEGEAVSSEIICRMLAKAGCSELATFDCHFMKKEGETTYGGLKIKSVSLAGALAEYFRKKIDSPLFISPDQGAAYMVGGKEKAMVKVRGEYSKGETAYREVKTLEAGFEVGGRNVVIIDDIIAGGGTMIRAVAACRKMGAKSVRCGCVHGLFLNGALQRILDEGAEEAVATNAIVSGASAISIAPHIGALL